MKNKEIVLSVLKKSDRSMDLVKIIKVFQERYTAKDLEELRDILSALIEDGDVVQRKDGAYLDIAKSNLRKGKIQIAENGYGFVLLDGNDLFVPKDKLKGACNGDTVIASFITTKSGKVEGKVEKIIKKNLGTLQGEIYDDNGVLKLKSDDDKVILSFHKSDLFIVDGSVVEYEILEKNKKGCIVKITEVIGHKNEPDIEIKKLMNTFNVPTSFSPEALREASLMPQDISGENLSYRKDLRDKTIFTIDGKDTKDIDDAISIERLDNGNLLIGVHLADVTHYVRPGSALWDEAMKRGNSNYLADRVNPMLPIALSNGICSLNEKVDRLAMSTDIEIDENGNIVRSRRYESVINSKKKMNYDDVNKIFNKEHVEGYEEFEKDLNLMLYASRILKKNKRNRGEMEIVSSEAKLIIDENHKMTGIEKRKDGLAENLIEDFMVVRNEADAKAMYDAGFPYCYRVHEDPSEEAFKEYIHMLSILGISINGKIGIKPKDFQKLLNSLKDHPKFEMLNRRLLRCTAKARYCEDNLGHFGLASEYYAHVTAAIRRASDMINQYLIKKLAINHDFNDEFVKSCKSFLPYICDHISVTERTADELEREVDDMYIAEYMENHIDDEYEGYIDSTLSRGFFVLTDELIDGFVSLDTFEEKYKFVEDLYSYVNNNNQVEYQIGDRVRVKCIAASKAERKVDFAVLKKLELKYGNNK